MKIPGLAIKNYQFTLTAFSLLLIVGITSFLTMPRSEDPPLDIPGASVIIIYPGSNPVDLEQLVGSPLEEALNELDDIKRMETTMRDGILITSVEFVFDTDPDEKFDEISQQVNSIRSDLPEEIYDINILEWSSSDVVMMHLALVSETTDYALIEKEAKKLKKQMEKVPGVKLVEILAVPNEEVRVSLDLEKMAQMNISIEQVSRSILSNNANIPGGSIEIGERDFGIKTSGSYQNLDEIRRTVVSSYMGRNIYLENIASVNFDYEDNNYLARYNGDRAVFLTVRQKAGYNIFKITGRLDEIIIDFKKDLDREIKLFTVFSQAESVDERINGFLSNLLFGILLVGLVIFLSLGFRASLLVIIAIPFSILIGLGFLDMYGFGLQQISIAGLVIALGLLVDNSIVIVENIERFIELGHSRREAAEKGSVQLGWPIISATATTMLAFIPIITMPDKSGRFIQSMPLTVIFTLFASLIIALLLTPYLSSVFLKKHIPDSRKREYNLKFFLRRLIEGPYRRTLDFALRKKGLMLLISFLLLAGSAGLFQLVGVSFFPKAEKPQFMIRIQTPDGTNIRKADEVARTVESMLDTIPLVKHYASNVGHGNPRIYYNIFPKRFEKNFAEIYVELKNYEVGEFDRLIASLRSRFADFPGAKIYLKEFEQGSPIEAPLTIKITGANMEILKDISLDFESMVRQEEGLVNIMNSLDRSSTDFYIHINREKASMFGVPVFEIDRTVRTAITGATISDFRDEEGNEYNIVLRLPFNEKPVLEDFDRIYVTSMSGRQIPLKQLARLEFREAPGIITHFDMDRNGTITADLKKDYSLDEIVDRLNTKFRDYPLPADYHFTFTGELESREESFGGMMRAGIIAIISIFAVLVLQFRSFSQPFIIFSALPLALIGSVLALFLTGYTFSFTALIGLISLIGIVVNNSIILVDYINKLIDGGKDKLEAVKMAGETRFIPIVLTTLTTIGGLLPLTLRGGTLWAPMGWTIIGGLLVSTFMSLLIVPVLYKMYTK
ncbi:efflux RND transporter permease subunit [Bacteroidota bacterium]